VLDRDVEFVTAGPRELADGDLDPTEFPLYNPNPHILSTEKLARLGWEPLTPTEAIELAVEGPVEPERDPSPDRAATERLLDTLQ
jgi:2'-hydroxyisoflavone reductase